VLIKIVDDAPEICATARSGLMCLTGHPGIRTIASAASVSISVPDGRR